METYTYAPLEKCHIRLVSVSLTTDDNLHFAIKHVELYEDGLIPYKREPPPYIALSYVWGDKEPSIPVTCNDGKTLLITTTVEEALRSAVKFNRHNYDFWIDQICINQMDGYEKSIQVGMMNEIFNLSKKVYGWLGPSDTTTPLAIKLIKRVGKIAKNMAHDVFDWAYEEDFSRDELETYEDISYEESEQLRIPFSDTESWEAFSDFFDNPYFERIWIVQEIMPARNALMICGTHAVSWALARNAATWYHYKASVVSQQHQRSTDGILFITDMNLTWNSQSGTALPHLAELWGQKSPLSWQWSMHRLVEAFRNRKATDPRDKIYALLGLSLSNTKRLLKVDYSKDLKTVYTEAAIAIIETHFGPGGNLDLILSARLSTCKCVEDDNEANWPSWVPDWRKHFEHGCQWGIGRTMSAWYSSGDAGKHTKNAEARLSDDIFALQVKGVFIGKVIYVSSERHVSDLLRNDATRMLLNRCLKMLSSYPTGEAVNVAFAMTLLGGVLPDHFKECGITTKLYAEKYLDCANSATETEMEREKEMDGLKEIGFDNRWFDSLMKAFCERRWYVLDTGYMGLGDYPIQEGDVIARLQGLSVPCILRPSLEDEYEYKFIGEAYCRGAMHQDVNDNEDDWSVDKEETQKENGKGSDKEKETNPKVKRNWKDSLRNWKRKGKKTAASNPEAVSKLSYGQDEMQDIVLR